MLYYDCDRWFASVMQFRTVTIRYDKGGFMYQGAVDLALTRIWLRDPVL